MAAPQSKSKSKERKPKVRKPLPAVPPVAHGARELPSVQVEGYSLQVREKGGA